MAPLYCDPLIIASAKLDGRFALVARMLLFPAAKLDGTRGSKKQIGVSGAGAFLLASAKIVSYGRSIPYSARGEACILMSGWLSDLPFHKV
eukprot:1137799-Pelagomonas_calceolata.AAC.2